MTDSPQGRPGAGEFDPYYAPYIALAREPRAMDALAAQLPDFEPQLAALTDASAAQRYAPGKWSVKQVLMHMADTEQVFAYRAMVFARADATLLPGFDENRWNDVAPADATPLRALVERLRAVRAASLALFGQLDDGAWGRIGSGNGKPMSVRAAAWVIAGHARHHAGVLRDRYGVKPA